MSIVALIKNMTDGGKKNSFPAIFTNNVAMQQLAHEKLFDSGTPVTDRRFLATALRCADLSTAIYDPHSHMTTLLDKLDLTLISRGSISETHSNWIMASSKEELIIAFRGTSDMYDVLTDSCVALVPYPNEQSAWLAHEGISTGISGFSALHEEIKKKMEENPKTKICITGNAMFFMVTLKFLGHSLGGGYAMLMMVTLLVSSKIPKNQIQVYTFGTTCSGKKSQGKFTRRPTF
jgi:hypothetical protein